MSADQARTQLEWVNIISFGTAAEILALHMKGDPNDAMGTMRRSSFTDRAGAERSTWSLIVEQILSARSVKSARSPRRRSPYPRLAAVGDGPPLPDDAIGDLWRDRDER
ncbi:MAG: hypothetical protein WA459_25175 [Stellaceae bacterium]